MEEKLEDIYDTGNLKERSTAYFNQNRSTICCLNFSTTEKYLLNQSTRGVVDTKLREYLDS